MLRFIKNILGKMIKFIYRLTYKIIPTHKKTVLFIAFHGRGYTDNPRAIYEYMIQQDEFKDYRFIWAIKHHKKKNISIEKGKIIEYFSIPYFFYLARSQYWIVNCKLPMYVLKKENQIYLQTWHGTPLKKLAFDIEVPEGTTFYRSGMNEELMHETYAQDVKKYNYMISPSAFTTEVFQSAFRINRERLIETGYPRNDFLTNYTKEDVLKIKNKYHIPLDKKVLLYAPTWRDNSYVTKGYTFKLEVDFGKWQEALGDEYVVVFKPHYLIVNDFDIDQYQGFVYFIEANEDISNLYIISDALVTDYSSVFFDYAILKRPIYFYMYDLVHYRDELRGFYLDIYHDLPGDIIEDENQLLVEMDGFAANEGVIVLAATNRPDVLDKALLRPGRFDRQIVVSAPDVKAREEILEVHSRKKKLAPDVELKTIAKNTSGFSGADLENVLNEAALTLEIGRASCRVKVTMGPEKRTRVRSEKEQKLVAYHEAGHAVVSRFLPTQDPVHQISIVPRGMAGGYTMYRPTEDKSFMSRTEMLETIISLLGGRASEQLILDDISTGASNDIERATKIARNMVTKYGMSERVGTITLGQNQEEVFLGRDFAQSKEYSEETAAIIDEEVKSIIDFAYKKAAEILNANMEKLHVVAGILLEKEKIDGEEFDAIFND